MRDPALKKARALLVLHDALHSVPHKEIARKFNMSESTVIRTLDWVKRAGLVTQFEDQILTELVPAAIDTFKQALAKGDTEVARDVFKGVGLLLRPSEKIAAPSEAGEDLEIYIRKIRNPEGLPIRDTRFKPGFNHHRAHQSELPSASESGADPGSIVEGSVIAATQPAPAIRTSGDEDCPPHSEQDLGLSADDAGLPPE